jgi:hypothetical protein
MVLLIVSFIFKYMLHLLQSHVFKIFTSYTHTSGHAKIKF